MVETTSATSSLLLADRPFLIYLSSKMASGEDFMTRFYESRVCVISTFRMLPPVAQKCFLHMLYTPNSDWKTWSKRRHMLTVYHSLRLLRQLGIVEGDFETTLQLNEDFRMNFSSSLLFSGAELSRICVFKDDTTADLPESGARAAKRRRIVDERDLLRECTERWECVLRYLALPSTSTSAADGTTAALAVGVAVGGEKRGVPDLTVELFQYIGFTRRGHELEISSSGFQFLLLNKIEQIWTYLIYCFKYLEEKLQVDVFSLVDFFLRLLLSINSSEDLTSRCQSMIYDENWPDEVKTFTLHLRELGLIYMRKRKDGFFFITPLLRVLAHSVGSSSASVPTMPAKQLSDTTAQPIIVKDRIAAVAEVALAAQNVARGFLVVETNFRVYAYTDSALQLAILSTFTELAYRFENVAVGALTRDSVRRSLQAGITAKQIIQYLRSNAHPQATSTHGVNCIPITVIDQLHLWEQERRRLTCRESTLYSTFSSEAEFVALRDFAQQNGVLLWHCNVQKLAIVSGDEGHELVRHWWRDQQT